jgi:hypothetical protein
MPFLPAIAAITAIVGTGVSIYGQRQAASAAEATGKYNAKLQRDQAVQTNLANAENARRKTRDNARVLGAQRAALAQSGLSMEGTPLAVLGETAMTLQRDILDMGYDAATKARALQAGANLSLYEGKSQASALRTSSVATGLSGVSSAAMGYGEAKGLFAPKTKEP